MDNFRGHKVVLVTAVLAVVGGLIGVANRAGGDGTALEAQAQAPGPTNCESATYRVVIPAGWATNRADAKQNAPACMVFASNAPANLLKNGFFDLPPDDVLESYSIAIKHEPSWTPEVTVAGVIQLSRSVRPEIERRLDGSLAPKNPVEGATVEVARPGEGPTGTTIVTVQANKALDDEPDGTVRTYFVVPHPTGGVLWGRVNRNSNPKDINPEAAFKAITASLTFK